MVITLQEHREARGTNGDVKLTLGFTPTGMVIAEVIICDKRDTYAKVES
jgi:hypothetical protein